MATTGFWPVKGSLKAVIEYADNPDKTIEKKFLDEDLAKVVSYAENDQKTDKKMYVSGIHCSKCHAYEDMLAVQKRFGLRGQNIAYHGYQSFRPDEITPDEAHRIGVQTANKMWGDRYQVLVTTHLNTDSVHNHIVVNAVSYM
ncbi:MAG: relaxase/mobilization nuclease domain-containing protein, partial [Firmicutes bacterium]|nr:relaxase/mobilization nuclease domain-containing protein [Bacillota bacterium]